MGEHEAKKIDIDTLYDLLHQGKTQKQIAVELGISIPTLTTRIANIQEKQGLLLKYRNLQNLQLTELQARILEAITPDKIAEASLSDLVAAFRILKDKELVSLGKPNEITGLVGYLVHLEKEDARKNIPLLDIEQLEQLEEIKEIVTDIMAEDYKPELG